MDGAAPLYEHLTDWLRYRNHDEDWFRVRFSNQYPHSDFSGFIRNLKRPSRTKRPAVINKVLMVCGLSIEQPTDFFTAPERHFPVRRDRVFFNSDSNDAYFRCQLVEKPLRDRLSNDVATGKSFWQHVGFFADFVEQDENLAPMGTERTLGISQELLDAKPSRMKAGCVVALHSHLNVNPYMLPLPSLGDASKIQNLSESIGWSQAAGPHLRSHVCRCSFTDHETMVLAFYEQRDALNEESAKYLAGMSLEKRIALARIIDRLIDEMNDHCQRKDPLPLVTTTHHALHRKLFPDYLRDQVDKVLSVVLPLVNEKYVSDEIYRDASNTQHRGLVSLLEDDTTLMSEFIRWYQREQAFCIACCSSVPKSVRVPDV